MKSLHVSNFKRVHLGLLLDLILLFLLPVILLMLLLIVFRQFSDGSSEVAGITITDLFDSPSLAVRALYIAVELQYCLSALCSLLIVSGLGELESGSRKLLQAKRWFILLMLADGVAMLAHISDLLLQAGDRITVASVLYFLALLGMAAIRLLALRFLQQGYAEVLEQIGFSDQSRSALSLSRRVVTAYVLLILLVVTAFSFWLLDWVEPAKAFVRIYAVVAVVFYVVCRIQVVRFSSAVTGWISTLSE